MPEITQSKTGTGNAGPETERINWVSLEDAEKLTKHIGRRFVKRDDEKDAKKYFYQVLDIFAYQPSAKDPTMLPSTDQQMYKFNIQKYYRNKLVKVTRRDESLNQLEVQANQPVDSHESRGGNFVCVDPWASFPMDSAKFLAAYEVDTTE